jgi:hypothetical protein
MINNFKGLKATNREIVEKELWAFDTEDDSKGNVKQICAYNGEYFFHFKDTIKFRDWLFNIANRPLYMIATSLEYDLINIFGCQWNLLTTRLKADGRVIVSSRLNDSRLIFYDTLNHWQYGVAAMGKALKLPKLDMDLSSWEYVERDTEITWKYSQLMQSRYNKLGTSFNATLPSSSLELFRRNYLPFSVEQPPIEILEKLFTAYYGGRTEVFNLAPQTGTINYIDVNSMYPFVMLKPFPNPNNYILKEKPDLSKMGVCQCTLQIPNLRFGPVPYRTDRLIFPIGKVTGAWTYEEIKAVLHRGGKVLNYEWCIEFPDICFPFESFITALYKVKSESKDEIERQAAKLFMNSLYGKMGEKIDSVEMMGINNVPKDKPATCYGEFAFVNMGRRYPNHCNAIWAIYTTAYARLHLLESMELIEQNGGEVFYTDTDSLMFRGKLPNLGNKLGDWKLEGVYDFAHFLAPKLYALSEKGNRIVKAKGVPRDIAYKFFDEGKCSFSKPLRLRKVLARGLPANLWVEQHKERRSEYGKRKILDNGETRCLTIR